MLNRSSNVAFATNVFGRGEVAEPEAKLEHRTIKLKTNDSRKQKTSRKQ